MCRLSQCDECRDKKPGCDDNCSRYEDERARRVRRPSVQRYGFQGKVDMHDCAMRSA